MGRRVKAKPPAEDAAPMDGVFNTAAPPPPQSFVRPGKAGPPREAPTGRGPGHAAASPNPAQGPACTFGLGGDLLARNAVLFWVLTGLTYAAGLWILGYLLLVAYLAWLLASCGEGCSAAFQTCTCQWESSSSSDGGSCDPCGSCCGGDGEGKTTSTEDDRPTPGFGLAGGLAAIFGALGLRQLDRVDWSHHPDLPEFRADVWRIRGLRVCIGCSVTYPTFVVALAALELGSSTWSWGSWEVWLAAGVGLAFAQAISTLGWTRWRWSKAVVKLCLGLGLAAAFHGILASPWPNLVQGAALTGLVVAASLSALPRRRRIRAALRARA